MRCCVIAAWCLEARGSEMKRALQFSLALLLLAAAAAQAQLYKSVGPDGKITYSDSPPSSAARVESKALPLGGANTADMPFELSAAVKGHPVTLYTTKNCIPCDEGRKLLSERGVPFSEKTVNSGEDIAQFRKTGGDSQLPLLMVGRNKESGFEAGAWNSALTSAGYPESSKLPKSYRNPPPEGAAPAPKVTAAKQRNPDENDTTAGKPAATELPPAIGNAPPGFRF
jgi:glutaredoxin